MTVVVCVRSDTSVVKTVAVVFSVVVPPISSVSVFRVLGRCPTHVSSVAVVALVSVCVTVSVTTEAAMLK